MTTTAAQQFIERVTSDAEFATRVDAVKDDPAAVLALVRAEGYDATPDEIRDAFLEIAGEHLTEEQLAAIAGGLDTEAIIGIVVGVLYVGAVVGGLTAAAAAF